MSPTVVFKNSKPVLITGSQGGSMIINTVFQEILNVLEFDLKLSESNKKREFIINGSRIFYFMRT